MTTALCRTPHQPLPYLVRYLTTTAVRVVPSALALRRAGNHTSSGMRNGRGIVAMSADADDVAHVVTEQPLVSLEASLAALGRLVDAGDVATLVHVIRQRLRAVFVGAVAGDLGAVHFVPLRRCVSTVKPTTYLHVKRFNQETLEAA